MSATQGKEQWATGELHQLGNSARLGSSQGSPPAQTSASRGSMGGRWRGPRASWKAVRAHRKLFTGPGLRCWVTPDASRENPSSAPLEVMKTGRGPASQLDGRLAGGSPGRWKLQRDPTMAWLLCLSVSRAENFHLWIPMPGPIPGSWQARGGRCLRKRKDQVWNGTQAAPAAGAGSSLVRGRRSAPCGSGSPILETLVRVPSTELP